MLVGVELLVPPPQLGDRPVPAHEQRLVIVDLLLPDGHILPPLSDPVSDHIGRQESGDVAIAVPPEPNVLLEIPDGCVAVEKDNLSPAREIEDESNDPTGPVDPNLGSRSRPRNQFSPPTQLCGVIEPRDMGLRFARAPIEGVLDRESGQRDIGPWNPKLSMNRLEMHFVPGRD